MPKQYYLPSTEAELVVWFTNYAAKVQTWGTAVGMSAGEKTQATTDSTNVARCASTR